MEKKIVSLCENIENKMRDVTHFISIYSPSFNVFSEKFLLTTKQIKFLHGKT
ncbi:hypothetical protein LguiA_026618 [Lonicera macranthoides]